MSENMGMPAGFDSPKAAKLAIDAELDKDDTEAIPDTATKIEDLKEGVTTFDGNLNLGNLHDIPLPSTLKIVNGDLNCRGYGGAINHIEEVAGDVNDLNVPLRSLKRVGGDLSTLNCEFGALESVGGNLVVESVGFKSSAIIDLLEKGIVQGKIIRIDGSDLKVVTFENGQLQFQDYTN